MANKKVGAKTGKSTQAGRDVYKTEDGENVSEKSTTFKYKGQWINVPSIHKGYQYDDDILRMMLDAEVISPTSTHKSESDAVKAAVERSKSLKFNKGGDVKALGDLEFEATLSPLLKKDPIAMLGLKVSRAQRYGEEIIKPETIRKIPEGVSPVRYQALGNKKSFSANAPASYNSELDIVSYGPRHGASLDVIIHELRHRGLQILAEKYGDAEEFASKYGSDSLRLLDLSKEEGTRNQSNEFVTELYDNKDAVYTAPNTEGSNTTEKMSDTIQFVDPLSASQPVPDALDSLHDLYNFSEEDLKTMRDGNSPREFLPKENIKKGKSGLDQAAVDLLNGVGVLGFNQGGSVLSKISLKDSAVFIAEMTPIIGDAMAAKDIWDEIQREDTNWGYVGALGGAAIVGLIPGIGDLAAKAIKVGAKKGLSLAKRIDLDTSSMGSGLGNVKFKPKVKVKEPFDLKALATASKQNDASREILVDMPIDDFLMAAKKEINSEKLAGTRELVKSGTPFNSIPSLSFKNIGDGTGQIVGHEGRHRAIALKEVGETTIPVRLMSDASETGSSIRWGKQNDPKDMDYVEVLPTKLIEEEGKAIVNMPALAANIRKLKQFAEGGSVNTMNNQMRMFEEGGIADDGMTRDPVSGNEIPPGSMAEEVRDDIPAQLSEGEYVVPADVVRFFGVKYFEDLRTEAKMGLSNMESNGRIGGEPVPDPMQQADMGQEITDQDLAQLEQMLTTGVANGGLMDKMAFAAKNDRVINQRLNAGGLVVSFAEGGAVTQPTSSYADPNKVDQVITRVMAAVQQNPKLLEELSQRGIQVSRTNPNMPSAQMNQANPPAEATKSFAEGGYSSAIPGLPSWAGTLGGSYMQPSGYVPQPAAAVVPAVSAAPAATSAAPNSAAESCRAMGMGFDPVTGTCVLANTDDFGGGSGGTAPPEPTEVKFKEPDQDYFKLSEKELAAIGTGSKQDPFTKKGAAILGTLAGGPLGLAIAAYPSIKQGQAISEVRAAALVAKARGFDSTAEALNKQADELINNSSFLVQGASTFGALSGQNAFVQQLAAFSGKDVKITPEMFGGNKGAYERALDALEERKSRVQTVAQKLAVETTKQQQAPSAAQAQAAGIYTGSNDDNWDKFGPAVTGTRNITDSGGSTRTVATYDPEKVKEIAKEKGAPGGKYKGGLMRKRKKK